MAASSYPFSHPRLRAPPSPRFSLNTPRRLPSPSHPLVLRQPVSSILSLHASYGPSFHSPSNQLYSKSTLRRSRTCMRSSTTDKEPEEDANGKALRAPDEEVNNLGVRAALSMLKFYKKAIVLIHEIELNTIRGRRETVKTTRQRQNSGRTKVEPKRKKLHVAVKAGERKQGVDKFGHSLTTIFEASTVSFPPDEPTPNQENPEPV